MTDEQNSRKPVEPGKRPYHRPRLLMYGDVNNLTRAKNFTNPKNDGSTGMWGPWTLPLRS